MRHQSRRSPAVRTRRRQGGAPPAAPAVCGGSAGWRYLPPEMKTNVSESHDALSGVGQREESTVNGSEGKAQMLMAPVTVGRLELVPQRERALPSSDGSRATGSRENESAQDEKLKVAESSEGGGTEGGAQPPSQPAIGGRKGSLPTKPAAVPGEKIRQTAGAGTAAKGRRV
ncbi:hypothetical protein Tc00.1047053481211.20 [Trypanosoma cruzi]|uniref:Uncharacterized protein n=1 Tax=Trypanosoma cruzi (strain CL Brener) TaxID=353153 RepID=Q4CRT5_TRYCC|nr:uncharacterized protein Tc00.1047053481211.20 [Trypanosoma cruzi]EAN82987.1 hypothetical protein Tc00.1047053481211.20 [Trypanosoma cruzi]|eukprot:XP_804838.1 hypothetical protein Tc00.1047053481211.20 [Trypanosoma cruzi strain CL Brener]